MPIAISHSIWMKDRIVREVHFNFSAHTIIRGDTRYGCSCIKDSKPCC